MIDLAQAEVLIRALDWTWAYADRTGKDRERAGNRDVAFPPSGIYRCVDGFAAVSARDDAERAALSRLLGGDAAPDAVAAFAAARTRDEIVRASEESGFSAAPVAGGRDQYESPHLRARGTVWELSDSLYGRIDEFGPVPKLSESPGRIKSTAKPVGYHNEQVLGGLLGLSKAEMEALERKKVIGRWDQRFLRRIFTSGEIRYCRGRAQSAGHFAARFAAKEAFLKSLGLGMFAGVGFQDVEVTVLESGKPELRLHGKARAVLESRGVSSHLLSLSHSNRTAAAVVVLEKDRDHNRSGNSPE